MCSTVGLIPTLVEPLLFDPPDDFYLGGWTQIEIDRDRDEQKDTARAFLQIYLCDKLAASSAFLCGPSFTKADARAIADLHNLACQHGAGRLASLLTAEFPEIAVWLERIARGERGAGATTTEEFEHPTMWARCIMQGGTCECANIDRRQTAERVQDYRERERQARARRASRYTPLAALRRAPYHCMRCGQVKRGHVCPGGASVGISRWMELKEKSREKWLGPEARAAEARLRPFLRDVVSSRAKSENHRLAAPLPDIFLPPPSHVSRLSSASRVVSPG